MSSGVHSDLHTAKSAWSGTEYPCVPVHEIVGRVTKVGVDVKAFTVGSLAAVGCMVGGIYGVVAVAFHERLRLTESLTIDRAFVGPGDPGPHHLGPDHH